MDNENTELARVSHPSLLFVLTAMLVLCAVAAYWCAFGSVNFKVRAQGVVFPFERPVGVAAPADGTVERVLAGRGAEVAAGDALLLLRAGAESRVVEAPQGGTVLACRAEGEAVAEGAGVAWLLAGRRDGEALRQMLVYVAFDDVRSLRLGQQVQVTPADLQREDCGYAYGRIVGIERFPTDRAEVAARLRVEPLASFVADGAVYEVRVVLDAPQQPGASLRWSRARSAGVAMGTGTLCNVQVVTGRKKVWEVLVGRVADAIDDMAGR